MSRVLGWSDAKPAPVVLITGSEHYLAGRAIGQIKRLLREQHPNLEITEIAEGEYSAGMLFDLASPSLFAEPRLLLIQGAAEGLLADLKTFMDSPADEASVVVRIPNLIGHNGKVVKEIGSKAITVACQELKRENDKLDFVRKEFQRAGLAIDQAAVRALVGSFNTDLGELGAACSQLIARGEPVSGAVVESIFGGRIETNAFKIADAALSGNTAEAIKLFRHGFSTGLDSVALVAALSMRIRQLAKLFNNRNAQPAVLGMQPWQIDKARKELAGWSEAELADLVELCAQVDADVKGASRDPEYSIEKLLLAMSRAK